MNKSKLRAFGVVFTVLLTLLVPGIASAKSSGSVAMHRMYNRWTGEHFYTANTYERDSLVSVGWTYEGVGWVAPKTSGTPVYRLFNPYVQGGDHHYTTSRAERDALVRVGWRYEGVGWYSDDGQTVPLYREYNPYAVTGTHNYTSNKTEHSALIKLGWKDEGIAWYGVSEYVGTWRGTLSQVLDSWQTESCYGGRENQPVVTVTNFDSVAGTFTADISFIVHNHAPSKNAEEYNSGDQIITLRNVLFSNSTSLGFKINGSYSGNIGSGYLFDTKGVNDAYKVHIYNSGDELYLEITTSSTLNDYFRRDTYLLSRL